MAGVPLGGQRAEGQRQLVAVRADQGGAPLDLGGAGLGQRGGQRLRQRRPVGGRLGQLHRRPVRDRGRAPARPPPRRTPSPRAGPARRPAPAGRRAAPRRAGPGGCPRRPGCDRSPPARPAGLAGQVRGAQQGVALLDHPLVVGPHPGVPGLPADQQVVEVAAALGRVAPDQFQVLRGEQHQPQRAEHVPGPAGRRAAQPGPVGLARARSPARPAARGRRGPPRSGSPPRRRPSGPGGRPWRPGASPGSPRSPAPRPGWSCRRRSAPIRTFGPGSRSTPTRSYERKSTSSSRRTYTGVWMPSALVDGVAAELLAQRGDGLHGRRVVLAGGEAGEERGGDHVQRHGQPDRLVDRPAALAGVLGVAAQLGQLRVLVEGPVQQVEQPGADDGALAPGLEDARARWSPARRRPAARSPRRRRASGRTRCRCAPSWRSARRRPGRRARSRTRPPA